MNLGILVPADMLFAAASPEAKSGLGWLLASQLSLLIFLQYATWGTWIPLLAPRLLGTCKFNGKQTSAVFAMFSLACLITPMLAGKLSDRWINAEYLMVICHLLSAVALCFLARATSFFAVMLSMFAFSLVFGPTLGLSNTIVMRHGGESLLLWAPIGWAAAGYFVTGVRQCRRVEADGSDALYMGAAVSAILAGVCAFWMVATEPKVMEGDPLIAVLGMLREPYFVLFLIVSTCAYGMQQFFYMGTGPFMQSLGISTKNIPAAMAVAQVTQAVATATLLAWLWQNGEGDGPKITLVTGLVCGVLLYSVYMVGRPRWLIVASQSLFGLLFVLFIMAGWLFANQVAPAGTGGSAQQLIQLVENGVGVLLSSLVAGFVIDRNRVGDQVRWSRVWLIPLGVFISGAILMAVFFHPPQKPASAGTPAAVETTEAAQ